MRQAYNHSKSAKHQIQLAAASKVCIYPNIQSPAVGAAVARPGRFSRGHPEELMKPLPLILAAALIAAVPVLAQRHEEGGGGHAGPPPSRGDRKSVV